MHEHDVVHRDFKDSNIFINIKEDGTKTYKIGDFGFAKQCESQK